MEIYGEVGHYAGRDSVEFYFKKIEKKDLKTQDDSTVEVYNPHISLPFLLWQKFKNSKLKITVEKMK